MFGKGIIAKTWQPFLLIFLLLTVSSCKKNDNPADPADVAKYGSISGKVLESAAGNPVSKVTVKTDPSTSSVFTDDNGSFEITNVVPGEYSILAIKTGFDTSSVKILVNAGGKSSADITLYALDSLNISKTGTIKGKIIDLSTNLPLPNVVITTIPATSSITTDSQGLYVLNFITPGSYFVSAKKNGYQDASTSVIVSKGLAATANMILKTVDSSSIQGIVREGVSGKPLEGVSISTDPATNAVTTDASGKYLILKVSSGTIKVSASKTNYNSVTQNITVTSGMPATADFELVPVAGSIRGIVTAAENGLPIKGVNIKTNPGTSTVTTDSLGNYQISNITPGAFTVTADKNGYQTGNSSVTVKAGITTTADIVLKK